MNHEEAALLLDDLRLGRLAEEQRQTLEQHLADCSDCRAVSAAHEALLATLQEDARTDAHPGTELLVDYAVERGGLDAADRERIENHLRACRVCQDAVERTRAVDEIVRADAQTAGGGHVRPWARYAMAASVTVLMLLAAADIAIRLNRPDSDWTGNVGLSVLSGTVRGDADDVTIHVRDGQPYVPLAVDLDVALARLGTEAVEFVIRREDGEAVWTASVPVDRVRREVASSGLVAFLVPARSLRPGSYGLVVRKPGATVEAPLLEVRFRVAEQAGT